MPDIDELRYDQALDEVMSALDPIDFLQGEVQEGFADVKKQNEKLENQVKNSWKNLKGMGIGFLLGIIASLIATMVFGFLF